MRLLSTLVSCARVPSRRPTNARPAHRCRVKQASRGYFHDYNELRQQGGKAFVAPKTLIREDVRPSALEPSPPWFARATR